MARNLMKVRPAAAVAAPAGDDSVAGLAVMEFQSPTLTLVSQKVPFTVRMTVWVLGSFVIGTFVLFGIVPVDKLVSVTGVMLAQSPNVIVQPLETAIVRKIFVKEGEVVKKGELLAELDPTFATSDEQATLAQYDSLRAQVNRLKAELSNKPYVSDGSKYGQLEELAYLQRHQQFVFTLEDYNQRIAAYQAQVRQSQQDVDSLTKQLTKLQSGEQIRKQLERMQVGSKLNTFQAELDAESGAQKLTDAQQTLVANKHTLDSAIAERDSWLHQWYSDTQSLESQQERLLSDMRGQVEKNELRRKLVDMRATTDSIVLSISRVAPGTVLQSGTQLMTTVPIDAPLEAVVMIDGEQAGFVKVGDAATIKFQTLPYIRFGYAVGHVSRISADSFLDPTQGQSNPAQTQPNIDANSPQNNGMAPTYYYRAYLSIDQLKLRNTPDSFQMKPGLPLQVDIRTGRRTVLQYLVDRAVPFMAKGLKEPF